jgi:NAD(P)H-dependent flavin oxidoreductase YrpB (nitropropane dioxygenase family)
VSAGVDALVVQGIEAGGHVRGDTEIRLLLPAVLERASRIPVLAAGGVTDGDDVAEMLLLGADGVWVGTRFLCCHEAAADRVYQEAILRARDGDTWLGEIFNKGWEGAPHRILINSTVRAWLEAGRPPVGTRPGEQDIVATSAEGLPIERYRDTIPVLGMRGDLEALALYAGVGAARISKILTASQAVAELSRRLPA